MSVTEDEDVSVTMPRKDWRIVYELLSTLKDSQLKRIKQKIIVAIQGR